MDGGRNKRATGGAAVEEPFFTEEAEEEALPVVPLRQAEATGTSSVRRRGRLSQSLNLLLAVILAGAAGAVAGYFVFREQAPQPAIQASETIPVPPALQPTVDSGTNTSSVEKDETPSRPEPPVRVEPEHPMTSTAESPGRDAEEERVGHGREQTVRDEHEEARPRQEEVTLRAEPQRRTDERQIVRRREENRGVRRDDEQDGRPKARLVGTITVRPRRY